MNKNIPLVSIVIPSYNHEKYVTKAVESIWEQAYSNIELIVIDDGSKDNTPSILLELKNKSPINMTVLLQKNEGATKTINRGINMATGKYFVYLSSDDYMSIDSIKHHVKFLESINNENIAGCYGDYTIVNEEGKALSFNIKKEMNKNNQFLDVVKRRNQAVLSASTLKMEIVKKIMFDPDIFLGDWDFFLNLTQKYRMLYLTGNTYFYRQVETGMNRDLEKMFLAREQIFNKYKDNEFIKNNYGLDKFKAEITMANAISFFHIGDFNSAKPIINKVLKLNFSTFLKNINFIIKIYMGKKLVENLRIIKHKF